MPTQRPTRVFTRMADPFNKPLHLKPTFHCFMDLPLELQMHIFTLTARKLSKEDTHALCFRLDSGQSGYLGFTRSLGVGLSAQALRIGARRRRLIGTCKLAQLMILEVWRKEMNVVNMHEILRGFPEGSCAERLQFYDEKRSETVQRIEWVTVEVKAWMKGGTEMLALEQ